jgi:HSP20 family protein
MVEMTLKPDPQKPGFYVLDTIERLSPDVLHLHLTVRPHAWRPPTDVFETDEAVVVRVEIAGMAESDFIIVLDGHSLSIRGIRPDVSERRAYYQMEIRFGEFSVDIELPSPVEVDKVEAIYQNGFLRVILPKASPKHIKID